MQRGAQGPLPSARRLCAVDLAVAVGLAVVAAAIQIGRGFGARPFLLLGADSATLASWAAGLDHPDLFAGDSSLGDPSNFRFYFTVHVPVLRLLAPLAGGYGNALISLLGVHVFVQGLGFYVLGRVLFASRFFAVLLAALSLAPVPLPLYERWGILSDPLPRFGFQALLPWLMAAALAARGMPGRWPWLLVGAGLLMYVHPVSAPPWAFAVWAGLWIARPAGWSLRRQLAVMSGLGLLFLAVAAPFAFVYLGSHDHGAADPETAQKVAAIMRAMLPRGYLDAGAAVSEFMAVWRGPWGLFWIWSVLGAGLVGALRPAERARLATLGVWAAALLLICVGGPLLEQAAARAWNRLPVQIDLIRGVRYLVPLMLALSLWPLAALASPAAGTPARPRVAAAARFAGLALTALWIAGHPLALLEEGLACWSRGRLTCVPRSEQTVDEAMQALRRETPAGARILPTPQAYSLQVRFEALRPVVHSRRDFGVLLYANHEALLPWYEHHLFRRRVERLPRASSRFRGELELAAALGAEYLLADPRYAPPPGSEADPSFLPHEVLWRNEGFTLVRLGSSAEHGAVP